MPTDHYATLSVAPDASHAEMRAAYLKLARAYHPDGMEGAARSDAEARMQSINEAWSVLGVRHKRQAYDRRQSSAHRTTRTSTRSSGPRRGNAHFRPFDDDAIMGADIEPDPSPLHRSRGVPRWLSLMPFAALLAGAVMFGLGLVVEARSIIAFAAALAAVGGIGFLLVPMLVMSRAEKDPHL